MTVVGLTATLTGLATTEPTALAHGSSRMISTEAVYPAPSNTVELALVDQHELASVARAFAATRPVHTVTELCGAMSRQPLQVRRLPRAAIPIPFPVGHCWFPFV